ncbi:MAG: hypothetical protein H7235_11200 [Bdellovibrionaceae bacterium]|nr:hypothetical protein [Pseudobdellovibrionaceae bacterium]
MTGLIWIIQLLHYPSYHYIKLDQFSAYQRFHTNQITYIVGPVMLVEVLSGIYITIINDWSAPLTLNLVGLCLIWLSTLLFSIPSHNKLNAGFDHKTISYLVNTNWIRTLTWTLRSILMLCLLS